MGTTSVRRNLFHHNLSRRPVSAAPSSTAGQAGSSTVSNASSHRIQSSAASTCSEATTTTTSSLGNGSIDNGEIVVKDKNGGYKLDIPVLHPIVLNDDEEEDEMEGVDVPRNNGGSAAAGVDSTGETEISGREKEKIEASLVEMMRNRNRQMSSEPAEILNLIHQSLRSKAAALDEDNWMYEAELDPRA